jgi:hypothetical protein
VEEWEPYDRIADRTGGSDFGEAERVSRRRRRVEAAMEGCRRGDFLQRLTGGGRVGEGRLSGTLRRKRASVELIMLLLLVSPRKRRFLIPLPFSLHLLLSAFSGIAPRTSLGQDRMAQPPRRVAPSSFFHVCPCSYDLHQRSP